MQNKDFQTELLKETVEPDKALTIAIKFEMGTPYYIKMNVSKSDFDTTVNQVQQMRIEKATPY